MERVNLFSHVANIGDTRSLILHPVRHPELKLKTHSLGVLHELVC